MNFTKNAFKKSFLFAAVLSCVASNLASFALAEPPKLWIAHDGGLSSEYITDGKEKVDQGFFGLFDLETLAKAHTDIPELNDLLAAQSKNTTYAHLSYWFGTLPSAAALGIGLGLRDTPTTLISAATLVGTSLLTAVFVSKARYNMFEAINRMNGVPKHSSATSSEVISPAREEKSELPTQPSTLTSSNGGNGIQFVGMSFEF